MTSPATVEEQASFPGGSSNEDQPAWILDSLFLGPDRRYRRIGSLVLGLTGPFLFAVASCAAVGMLAVGMASSGAPGSWLRAAVGLLAFLVASGSYFAAMITLHLYASCQLPISIRLTMIYFTVFVCLSAIVWPSGEAVTSGQVLIMTSLSVGGFLLRGLRGWRTRSWNQPLAQRKITIFSLLDVTTAVAMTLGLISLEEGFSERGGMACLVPSLVMFVGFGLHVWARLLSICPVRQQAGSGFGIWMAVNILWAFLVFVSFAVGISSSPVGLLGFVAAPGSLLVAHVWTEIPIRWLRGCGWTMVRVHRSSGGTTGGTTGGIAKGGGDSVMEPS